jgi:CheY-like chemotaxis protein
VGVRLRRLRLIHWNADEAEERSERLRRARYVVDAAVPTGPASLRALRDDPPDAIVIDLGRLPSHGREFGVAIRMAKATRHVPLVFVDGVAEKVDAVRKLLPDAVYTTWDEIEAALPNAIAAPPSEPVAPQSVFAAYEGVPLARKLGIRPDAVVGLVRPPDGFAVDDLPDGAVLRDASDGACDLVLWFTETRAEVEREIVRMSGLARDGDLWVLWPKRSSGRKNDLTQPVVRRAGLDRGLVDYKVVSVDDTWTGLKFRPRK